MSTVPASPLDPYFESIIDAFEATLSAGADADLAHHLPDRSDPQFLRIARELVRVDLEWSWRQGRGKGVHDYESLVPEIRHDPSLRSEIAFEEFRQRKCYGHAVTMDAFAKQYGIEADKSWSTATTVAGDTRVSPAAFAELSENIPAPGAQWRDFEILREIGRGGLSRVLLARQTSLSSRLVVLKFAPRHFWEAEKLARLQHPHIVPVFSVYEDHDFHVFCMPYLGCRTLADGLDAASLNAPDEVALPSHNNDSSTPGTASSTVSHSVRLPFASGPFERRVLSLAVKLASAIDHAHQRGILHNDIKPVNILLSDDEQPMLLDFNLAAESQLRVQEWVGGTVPYMAPEAIRSLAGDGPAPDERSDLFSLGVVLYELLTGVLPFAAPTELANAAAARATILPSPAFRRLSNSTQMIVAKSLAYSPLDRYQSATELLTDLRLQLVDRPLRHAPNRSVGERVAKWCRRHPRLSSLSSVATLSAVVLVAGMVTWISRERSVQRSQAATKCASFHRDFNALLPRLSSIGVDVVDTNAALSDALLLLSRYVVAEDELAEDELAEVELADSKRFAWLELPQQHRLRQELGELAFMTAAVQHWQSMRGERHHLSQALRWNALSQLWAHERRMAPAYQRASLLANCDDPSAEAVSMEAAAMSPRDARDWHMLGVMARINGNSQLARDSLEEACRLAPRDSSNWFDLGLTEFGEARWERAEHCLTTCLALQPDLRLALYCRGLCRRELGRPGEAIDDFNTFLSVAPSHPVALINRAVAYEDTGQLDKALNDLNLAIHQGWNGSRPLIIRSRVRRELGDIAGANVDLRRAVEVTPKDEHGWIARGVANLSTDPHRAHADFEEALRQNPRSFSARRYIAQVLAQQLNRSADAVAWLDSHLADWPDEAEAYGDRGLLLSRLGQFDRALMDADQILKSTSSAEVLLKAAAIYALASQHQPERKRTAVAILATAFRSDPSLVEVAKDNPDLIAIHDSEPFHELCNAIEQLARLSLSR